MSRDDELVRAALGAVKRAGAGEGEPDTLGARRRVLFDYDSTLNPGQGNAPLTRERAAMNAARFVLAAEVAARVSAAFDAYTLRIQLKSLTQRDA